MPRFDAPSISTMSSDRPAVMVRQLRALVARLAVAGLEAVGGAGQDSGDRRLSDAALAGEEVGVGDVGGDDGVAKRADDVVLADDVGEPLRPPTPVQ